MKKMVLICVIVFFAISAMAQEVLRVESSKMLSYKGKEYCEIHLSDGSFLYYLPSTQSYHCSNGSNGMGDEVFLLFDEHKLISKGELVRRYGHTYSHIEKEDLGIVTIKKVKRSDINSEFEAHINGAMSYDSFVRYGGYWGIIPALGDGKGKANGTFKADSHGGTKTIIIIYFSDGHKICVDAIAEPLWLGADPGDKAKCCKADGKYLYELI